jgi:hypothetical protein
LQSQKSGKLTAHTEELRRDQVELKNIAEIQHQQFLQTIVVGEHFGQFAKVGQNVPNLFQGIHKSIK